MKKEMLINVLQPEECRIAIVEDGLLEELYVERTSLENYTGNIYKGRVVNLEAAIQAAFIDFSVGRNGFLHVSDVEPQYYRRLLADDAEVAARDRGREPRRERDPESSRPRREPPAEPTADRERPAPAPRGRAAADLDHPDDDDDPLAAWDDDGGSADPPDEQPQEPARREPRRPRSRRERPDLSEKGRPDRSVGRRFGEGLVDEDTEKAPPARPEPSRPSQREVTGDREPAPRAPLSIEAEPPRARLPRPIDPIEAELPPSRTQRSRVAPPEPRYAPRSPHDDEFEAKLSPPRVSEVVEPDVEATSPTAPARSPDARRRTRGRGRGRGREREPELDRDLEDQASAQVEPVARIEPVDEPEVEFETDEPEPAAPPRRRGGRDAIRSRGGRGEPASARDESPRHPRGLAAEPTYEPSADLEDAAPAPPEPSPARPRTPAADRPRTVTRAGEPGYVPRRARVSQEAASEATPARESIGRPPQRPARDLVTDDEGDEGLSTSPAHEEEETGDRPKRRRRRRRRPRDREGEGDSTLHRDSSSPDDPRAVEESHPHFDADLEFDEHHDEPLPMDELDLDEAEAVEDEDEASGLIREGHTWPVAADEAIDPELEEEIRREIEEIAELEREMGLRGPIEARPRGGDHEAAPSGPGGRPRGRGLKPPIQEVFKRGDEVLVQVIKESIGTKGPTLSTYISIPGRYLVLMPGLNRVGVSRKIADEAQRRKLREIMNELNPPKGLGFIVRTAGLERTKRELAKDLAYLLRLWKVILRRIKKAKAPAAIYQESDMITRTIRDVFSSDIDTIWIDERGAFERAQEFLRVVMPKFVDRLKFYNEKVPLFHKYGIEDEITKIQRRHVPLPEGGSIVIDQTEALVAIDVNSGNFRVENDAERTAYEMNLRAAKEIARQLRLRDLGGVIVNDFIDMRDEKHRRGVEKALRDAVQRDRARTKILRMSQFGLIEMTRQRIRPSLKRSVYEDCPHCRGAGVVKTVESMSIEVMRLLALAAHRSDIHRVNICVHPSVATYLNNRKRPEIVRLETESNLLVYVHHQEGLAAEHLQLDCFDANGAEVRLLPATPPTHPRRR